MDTPSNTSLDYPNNTYLVTNFSNTYTDNNSVVNNSQYVSPLSGPGFLVFNVVMLLAVVLPVIAANTVLLVALVLESSTVKMVRLVLGSILVSSFLDALGLAMYHIAGIILNLSPVDNPPKVPCTITLFLIGFGGSARQVFMATFAIIVYIVKTGKDTKKYIFVIILVAVVTLWVLAFLGTSPLLSQKIVPTNYADSLSCGIGPIGLVTLSVGALYALFFAVVPLSVTVIFLAITGCFIKCHFTETQAQTALIKFGFFLLIGNDINLVVQVVPTVIAGLAVLDTQRKAFDKLIYTCFTMLNSALIPTPILVPIYFKPIRKRLRHWLCCCVLKKRNAKHMSKHSSTVEGSESVHGPEKAMKVVV